MPSTSKEVETLEAQLSEAQQAVARLAKQQNDILSSVATLTQDVADLKFALKKTQDWAKGQGTKHDNSITRYE